MPTKRVETDTSPLRHRIIWENSISKSQVLVRALIICVVARLAQGQARVLASSDIHAHNSFANPRGLEPRDEQVAIGSGGRVVYRFAPASVTRLRLTLS